MRFSWHKDKSDRTLRERGFDFAFATLIFDSPTLEHEDLRSEYGERRMIAIGLAGGMALTVCYTDRLGPDRHLERRIISARRSDRRERQAYYQAVQTD